MVKPARRSDVRRWCVLSRWSDSSCGPAAAAGTAASTSPMVRSLQMPRDFGLRGHPPRTVSRTPGFSSTSRRSNQRRPRPTEPVPSRARHCRPRRPRLFWTAFPHWRTPAVRRPPSPSAAGPNRRREPARRSRRSSRPKNPRRGPTSHRPTNRPASSERYPSGTCPWFLG